MPDPHDPTEPPDHEAPADGMAPIINNTGADDETPGDDVDAPTG